MAGKVTFANADTSTFDILMRFLVDKQGIKDVGDATSAAAKQLQQAEQLATIASIPLSAAIDAQVKKTQQLQNAWWKTQRVIRAAAFVFQQTSLVGVGMVAPFIAAANKFATESAKLSSGLDPVAEKWIALQEQVKKSTMSIGKTSAEVLLPAFEIVSKVLNKAAVIVQKNPAIIEAALKVGAAVASIGVLGALVLNGIKLAVDVKFVYASVQNMLSSEIMLQASKNNLLAAMQMALAGDEFGAQGLLMQQTVTGGGGGLLSPAAAGAQSMPIIRAIIASPLFAAAVLALALYVGGKIGTSVGNTAARKIYGPDYRDQKIGNAAQTFFRMWSLPMQAWVAFGNKVGFITDGIASAVGRAVKKGDTWIANLFDLEGATNKTAEATERLSLALKDSAAAEEIVAAYIQMVEDNAKAEIKYKEDVAEANEDALKEEAKLVRNLENDLSKLASTLKNRLTSLATDRANTDREKEIDYRNDRANIIADGVERERQILLDSSETITRIHKDRQDQIEKLERDHNLRISDLVAARDALGIVEENRKHAQDLADANNSASDQIKETQKRRQREIAESRRDTALRLQELALKFKQDKEARDREYAQKVAEAKAQYLADVEERNRQHTEQLLEARKAAAERLADLAKQYNDERIRRRDAFIAQVRDLDAALLGDKNLKTKYYTAMLADADRFLAAYRAKLPTGVSPTPSGTGSGTAGRYPGHAYGDWVSGRINTGELGPEFLLKNSTARAAQEALGGRLTQQSLIQGLQNKTAQIINVNMPSGVTFLQVKKMLSEHTESFAQQLLMGIGG